MQARARWEAIAAPKAESLTADAVYDLVFSMTDDEAAAQRAFNDYRSAELRAGITPKS